MAASGSVKIVAANVLTGVSLINSTPGPKSLPFSFVTVTLLNRVEVIVVLFIVLTFRITVATTEEVTDKKGQSHSITLAFPW